MNRRRFDTPPSQWAGAIDLGGDVYVLSDPGAIDFLASLIFWHWCPNARWFSEDEPGMWRAAGAAKHTLVSGEPLHLEPSLLWPCCGKHGWIREGRWHPA